MVQKVASSIPSGAVFCPHEFEISFDREVTSQMSMLTLGADPEVWFRWKYVDLALIKRAKYLGPHSGQGSLSKHNDDQMHTMDLDSKVRGSIKGALFESSVRH